MKDKEYKDLNDACDQVFLEDDSDIRMVISWPNLNEINQFIDILKVTNSDKKNILIKKILKYCNNKHSNLNIKPLIHILLN